MLQTRPPPPHHSSWSHAEARGPGSHGPCHRGSSGSECVISELFCFVCSFVCTVVRAQFCVHSCVYTVVCAQLCAQLCVHSCVCSFVCTVVCAQLCVHSFAFPQEAKPCFSKRAYPRAGLTTRRPLWLLALDKAPAEGDRLAARGHVRS